MPGPSLVPGHRQGQRAGRLRGHHDLPIVDGHLSNCPGRTRQLHVPRGLVVARRCRLDVEVHCVRVGRVHGPRRRQDSPPVAWSRRAVGPGRSQAAATARQPTATGNEIHVKGDLRRVPLGCRDDRGGHQRRGHGERDPACVSVHLASSTRHRGSRTFLDVEIALAPVGVKLTLSVTVRRRAFRRRFLPFGVSLIVSFALPAARVRAPAARRARSPDGRRRGGGELAASVPAAGAVNSIVRRPLAQQPADPQTCQATRDVRSRGCRARGEWPRCRASGPACT